MRIFQRRLHVSAAAVAAASANASCLVLPLHVAQNSPRLRGAGRRRIKISFRRIEWRLLFLAGGDDKRPQVFRQFVFRRERQRFALRGNKRRQ